MYRQVIVALVLFGTCEAVWAWPVAPNPKTLETSPTVVCGDQAKTCRFCWEGKRQELEQYRCETETFRRRCENFNSLVEEERRELEVGQKDGSIASEMYKQRLAEYRGKIGEYKVCIGDYSIAKYSYDQKMEVCQKESRACLKRLIRLNQ